MTIKFSRAQRRADRARLKVNRQFYWGYGRKDNWFKRIPERGVIDYMNPRQASNVVNNPASCSCWMCGNPRRGACPNYSNMGTLTKQEMDAKANYEDGVKEWVDYFLFGRTYWDDDNPFEEARESERWEYEQEEFKNWKWAKARGWVK